MKILQVLAAAMLLAAATVVSAEPKPGTVSGTFTLNGEQVVLKHAYVVREEEGFYDPADPTWTLVFTAAPVAPRDIDDRFIDPSIRIGLTLTSEFGDGAELQVLSQNFLVGRFSLSGGEYPQLDLQQEGPDVFAGRVYLAKPETSFDNSYQYELRFHALPVDPNAPIGAALPKGGGEPGAAYLAWTKAVHSGDVAAIKRLVTPEMAAMLDTPEAAEELEFMAIMTPSDVRIVEGSSDGATAILKIEGQMEGEAIKGEITLERQEGNLWIPTASSLE